MCNKTPTFITVGLKQRWWSQDATPIVSGTNIALVIRVSMYQMQRSLEREANGEDTKGKWGLPEEEESWMGKTKSWWMGEERNWMGEEKDRRVREVVGWIRIRRDMLRICQVIPLYLRKAIMLCLPATICLFLTKTIVTCWLTIDKSYGPRQMVTPNREHEPAFLLHSYSLWFSHHSA